MNELNLNTLKHIVGGVHVIGDTVRPAGLRNGRPATHLRPSSGTADWTRMAASRSEAPRISAASTLVEERPGTVSMLADGAVRF